MRRTLTILTLSALLALGCPSPFPGSGAAYAQPSGEIAGALSRLKNNPRYRGRILGVHVRQQRRGYVYEVRILRPDDRVILVYIDPATGGVIGDSERRRSNARDGNDSDADDGKGRRDRPARSRGRWNR